jgi:hypothetical protein
MNNFSTEIVMFGSSNVDQDKLNEAEEMELARIKASFPHFMFHPNRWPKSVWNVVLALLLIYTALVMPYRMAFIDSKFGDDWFIAELIIDMLFFCDVLVNIFSAYVDNDGNIITNRKMIF